MTFGEKLQKLRAREGLSQDALAEILEVSRQAVSKWERDETLPEAEKVIRISRHFQVTTDYLLKDEVETPERPAQGGPWRYARPLGWTLVALGAVCLLRLLPGLVTLLGAFWEAEVFPAYPLLMFAPHLLLSAALLAVGVWLLRRKK